MPGSGIETDASLIELPRMQIGGLFPSEMWWRDRYRDLDAHGYRLRNRYHPDWEPSWKRSGKDFFDAEDGQPTILRAVMDAVRIEDGRRVMLKKVLPEEGPYELIITELFSSPGLKRDPRNHCVPLLDLVDLSQTSPDGRKLMVIPFLRPFKNPRFQTYGEFVAFFMQISEGLKFMHERKVAHRDCTVNNIMFDSSEMYPKGYHPVQLNRNLNFKGQAKRYTRTARPPRYYLIDFGLSRRYSSRNALDEPLRGGDKSAPEHRHGGQCNPFRTDIYYLGNLVRGYFVLKYNGFEFMRELVDAMTDENPAMRPTIEEVIEKFDEIRSSLSTVKLRSRIISKKDSNMVVKALGKQLLSSQEELELGDDKLNQARDLVTSEVQSIIEELDDLRFIETRITYAREMKAWLNTKSGIQKFFHARKYHELAKAIYQDAKSIPDRAYLDPFQFRRQLGTSSEAENIYRTARSLYRCWLSCNDAFPSSFTQDKWVVDVWNEACLRTHASPHFLRQDEEVKCSSVKLLNDVKTKTKPFVDSSYEFDTSQAPHSISRDASRAQELLAETTFIYQDIGSSTSLDTIRPPINHENPQLLPYPSCTTLQSNGSRYNASFLTSPSYDSLIEAPNAWKYHEPAKEFISERAYDRFEFQPQPGMSSEADNIYRTTHAQDAWWKEFKCSSMKLFNDMKTKIKSAVDSSYEFDTSQAPLSISHNASRAQELLAETTFIYREFNFGRHLRYPYRHPIIQKVVNITWFQNKGDIGIIFHEEFAPIPFEAIALVLTVIECCIDEWSTGTWKESSWEEVDYKTHYLSHLNSLRDLHQKGIDPLKRIQDDLLKAARKHAGAPPHPTTGAGKLSLNALDATI